MRIIGTSLRYVVALIVLGILLLSTTGVEVAGETKVWQSYKSAKLKFALKYPPTLSLEEFADGVILVETDYPRVFPRDVVTISNDAFPRNFFYYHQPAEYFQIFRNAEPGRIRTRIESSTASYTKVENLEVDDYPAVKVIVETQTAPARPSNYLVSVYIRKRDTFWNIASVAHDKATQKKRMPTFERILATFDFL